MKPTDVVNYRVQNALPLPIYQRCDELTRLLNDTPCKDLQDAFCSLLDSIFSVPGWGLRTLDKNINVVETDAILRFLDPMGPLFSLAYKLGTDYFLKYELSLMSLPARLRRDLESGVNIPPLYVEKLQYDPHTRKPTVLLLSPFELLVFRFALHILPKLHPEVWIESVYLQLMERYLCHFLPCDPQAGPVQPLVPFMQQAQPRSAGSHSPFMQNSPAKQGQQFSLLKSTVAMNFGGGSPGSPGSGSPQSPLVEIWRTALLTQVLVDVWLCVEEENKTSLGSQLRNSLATGATLALSTTEHARMVRGLIKHMHYFANSACYTNPTAMDEMKRMILPSSKFKIYRYLTYTMNHWPLDTSFRIPLEAWLSYIQPWRYTNFSNYKRQENEESGKAVDRRWQIFIAEHLPAYTYIFRLLLARLQRMDLSSLKNTIMLHRIAKVFSLSNLSGMLSEVEESLSVRPGSQFHVMDSLLGGVNHADMQTQLRWQAAVVQTMAELEGIDAVYEPLFCDKMQDTIRDFLRQTIWNAMVRAQQLLKEQQSRQRAPGFWSSLLGTSETDLEEYTIEDRNRVLQTLQNSSQQFAAIFKVTNVDLSLSHFDTSQGDTSFGLNTSFFNSSLESQAEAPISIGVTPQFEGHPDKILICSYEVGWLVRMFHDISSHINQQYGTELQLLYSRPDIVGRLARQVLQPPCTYYTCERGARGYKVRTAKQLPARLRLRTLAHRALLIKLAALCVLLWCFGYGPIITIGMCVLLYACYVGVRALLE